MIILITGASHTGKTILAQRFLEINHYPCVSIDHIKMGLIRSKNTKLTVNDDAKLTNYLWPIVREMMKTSIENHQNEIYEGCYVPPDWAKDFDKYYLDRITFVCLVMSDKYIDNHFEDIKAHACDIENRIDDGYLNIENLKRDNHDFMNKFHDNYYLIDDDFDSVINDIVEKKVIN